MFLERDIRRQVIQGFRAYVDLFGPSACTISFQSFLEIGVPLFDQTNFSQGYVTASGIAFHAASNTILQIRHAMLSRWFYSGGGHVGAEEPVWLAAQREVTEEAGLRHLRPLFDVTNPVPLIINRHIFPGGARANMPEHPIFDHVYLFATPDRRIKLNRREVNACRWTDPATVKIEYSNTSLHDQMRRFRASPYAPHM